MVYTGPNSFIEYSVFDHKPAKLMLPPIANKRYKIITVICSLAVDTVTFYEGVSVSDYGSIIVKIQDISTAYCAPHVLNINKTLGLGKGVVVLSQLGATIKQTIIIEGEIGD